MSRPLLPDAQPSFSGGINTSASDLNVGQTQFRRGENVLLTQYGDAIRRGGTQQVLTLAMFKPIRQGFFWRRATSAKMYVVMNNVVFVGTYAIGLTTGFTLLATGNTFDATVIPCFAAFRSVFYGGDTLYMADGQLTSTDGAGGLNLTGLGNPALTQLAVYNQRLFGITGTDQTIHYSDLNDGDTCGVATATSGSAVVRTFSNQKLVGLLTLKNSLAMFHVSGVSRFVGLTQDDIGIGAGTNGISSDTGEIAPRSAIAVEGIGYFLSVKGAFKITDAGIVAIDSPTSPDPTIALLTVLPTAQWALIDAAHDEVRHAIRWYIPDVGIYVYDYRLNAWSGPLTGIYTSSPTRALFEGVDANGSPIILSGHDDGQLRLNETATCLDDVTSAGTGGNAYPMVVFCRRLFTEAAEHTKAWRFGYVFADLKGSTAASVSWSTETGSQTFAITPNTTGVGWGAGVWGAFPWGANTGNRPYTIPLSERGAFLDFAFADAGATATVLSRVNVQGFDYGPR